MTDRAELVLHGFLSLSSSEQQDVLDEIRRINNTDPTTRKSYERKHEGEFNRIVSGPISSGCACCGR